MFQSSDLDKKWFLKLTDYYYKTTVKDYKSCILRIRTLNCHQERFFNLTVKKSFSKKLPKTQEMYFMRHIADKVR